jgi:hypothetical protein
LFSDNDKKEYGQELEKSYQEEAVWEQIGCLPDFWKFFIWSNRARILKSMGLSSKALEWAVKARLLAPSVNKNAEEKLMWDTAFYQHDCRRYEETIVTTGCLPRKKTTGTTRDFLGSKLFPSLSFLSTHWHSTFSRKPSKLI